MKRIFVLLSVFLLSACSTLATLSVGNDASRANCGIDEYVPRVYSGIFNDIRLMKNPPRGESLFIITDLPFSLVLDTVVLPYTIPIQVTWGNICTPTKQVDQVRDNSGTANSGTK